MSVTRVGASQLWLAPPLAPPPTPLAPPPTPLLHYPFPPSLPSPSTGECTKEFDLTPLRLDWLRMQTYTSTSRSAMKITEHAQFVVAMNTIVTHSEFVDQLDTVCCGLSQWVECCRGYRSPSPACRCCGSMWTCPLPTSTPSLLTQSSTGAWQPRMSPASEQGQCLSIPWSHDCHMLVT